MKKETFIKCINSLQAVEEFQRGVLDLAAKSDPYADLGIMAYPDCSNALLVLLSEEMNDDEADWISYFCYELGFGKKAKLGDVVDSKGNPVLLATAEDLWNFLTEM